MIIELSGKQSFMKVNTLENPGIHCLADSRDG